MNTVWKWSISIIVIILLLIGAAFFSYIKITSEKSQEASMEEIKETFKPASEAAGNDESMNFEGSVQDFVNEAHNFYNETVGWGRDGSLDEDLHLEFADLIQRYFDSHSTDPIRSEDIASINELAGSLSKSPDFRKKVVQLHRYFHDLDIAVNDYKDFDKIWGVTKTLEDE
ncbi:hypothetical protein [Halobacillus massiliensis]|uniref:hypothetical protein n=1 Tax=Halobacillus massiliensis TaxID=1926286 RepID=UPI0009E2C225|nr:hypothetical protein [Halobacillus massiliensis]